MLAQISLRYLWCEGSKGGINVLEFFFHSLSGLERLFLRVLRGVAFCFGVGSSRSTILSWSEAVIGSRAKPGFTSTPFVRICFLNAKLPFGEFDFCY
jgi:hypothetical protein